MKQSIVHLLPSNTLLLVVIAIASSTSCNRNVDEGKKRIGPDVEASFVIYFRTGTTDKDINEFRDTYLYTKRADGRGDQNRYNTGSYLALLPQQANGHEAIAITFTPTATEAEIQDARDKISSAPIVLKIFENMPPNQIKPGDVPHEPSTKVDTRTANSVK